jgi:putative addiction module component (TIGR02574 family)
MEATTNWKEIVLSALSPAERIGLAMELWDSVPEEHQAELTAAQVAEIRRRIVEADAGRMPSYPWEEVRQRLLDRQR